MLHWIPRDLPFHVQRASYAHRLALHKFFFNDHQTGWEPSPGDKS